MSIKNASSTALRYPIQYPLRDYKFPTDDAIDNVHLDEVHIHLHLTDGRILSIPLEWIPPLYHAQEAERLKFYITDDRSAVVWDPDESEVNEILRLSDYIRSR